MKCAPRGHTRQTPRVKGGITIVYRKYLAIVSSRDLRSLKTTGSISALAARVRQLRCRAGDRADHAAHAVRDGRRRSQRAGKSECAGRAAREDATERRARQNPRRTMANGRAEVIPNTGHLVLLEAPAKHGELVLGFSAVAPDKSRHSCSIQLFVNRFRTVPPCGRERERT
jgi:hypothetical protein